MNILVITQMYSQPDDGGDNKPTRTVNYFVEEWVQMEHTVVVMHCPSKFPLLMYLLPNEIKNKFAGRLSTMVPTIESRQEIKRNENGALIFRLPMLKFFPGRGYSSGAIKKQADKIKKKLSEIGFIPDLVCGHFANPSTELVAILAEFFKSKSSVVFHRDCTEAGIVKYRIAQNIKRIGAIGCRSVIEAKQIQKSLGLDDTPFVCCSGVPNDAVTSTRKICNKHDFSLGIKHIYVGSLIKRKHLDTVIKSFLETSGVRDTLLVVGGGPEEVSLKQLVLEMGESNRITFTGRVSREQVLNYMKESQVFTLISDGETYGMVYIEAMLQGCLTIASKDGGFDGIIVDGKNGFICNPGDKDMLSSIYKRIANLSAEELNYIGQNAIDTAIHYSAKEVAERYLNEMLTRNK